MSIAANKRAARLFRKVAKDLTDIANDPALGMPDIKEMYLADAKDHKQIATLCDQHSPAKACGEYLMMDTASQDYFFEYLNEEQATWLDNYLEC